MNSKARMVCKTVLSLNSGKRVCCGWGGGNLPNLIEEGGSNKHWLWSTMPIMFFT